MKKIITLIAILFSLNASSQNLDTVSVSLSLRAQDWTWAIGKYGAGTDSVSRARIRQIRTAVIAANPPSWTTNVTINNVPGVVVMAIYNIFIYAPFGEIMNMGSNTAERTTIFTNIRAINNSALQYYIGLRDGEISNQYINYRKFGKEILIDN
jgi:hypothetical protein